MVEQLIILPLWAFLLQMATFIVACYRARAKVHTLPDLIWGLVRYNFKGYLLSYLSCFWVVCAVLILYYCLPPPLKSLLQ